MKLPQLSFYNTYLSNCRLPNLRSLWMLVAALGFAIMGALVKVGSPKFGSAELVFYRSAFGLLFIYVYIFAKKLPLKTPFLTMQMSRALVGLASLVLFFYAIAHLPLATAVTLNYTSALFLAVFMVSACTTDSKRVEEGLMMIGIRQSAFLEVWGNPAKTSVTSGQEIMRASTGTRYEHGYFFKGRETLEIWEYPDRKTVLIFSNKKLRDWKVGADIGLK